MIFCNQYVKKDINSSWSVATVYLIQQMFRSIKRSEKISGVAWVEVMQHYMTSILFENVSRLIKQYCSRKKEF